MIVAGCRTSQEQLSDQRGDFACIVTYIIADSGKSGHRVLAKSVAVFPKALLRPAEGVIAYILMRNVDFNARDGQFLCRGGIDATS